MFVIVMLDEGREQLLNLNCWIINFVYCLKAKCGLDLEESVDLMDRDGKLMNLTERAQSTDLVSSVLKERETYIPVRVSREFSCSFIKSNWELSQMNQVIHVLFSRC
ncbi:hypothetical protein IRJ41_019599 [Triplophysa rosa]|uniref:Uncharacterized protein n=1 Tax=Triplophysa rosa TaxID=992332 RepID=A0A9W7WFZ3_TRIRA|nr:hypothetical protein IRJ41_019599 [Triplophysa rosa]